MGSTVVKTAQSSVPNETGRSMKAERPQLQVHETLSAHGTDDMSSNPWGKGGLFSE